MGFGDQLMASGMARGAAKRGKRIAFGDGSHIIWDKQSEVVFRNNPNIAAPGTEGGSRIEWIAYYKGKRIYNRLSDDRLRWVWNYDFTAPRGEMCFTAGEKLRGKKYGGGFVLIEPNVELWKAAASNKDWGRSRYQEVASKLRSAGYEVKQFAYPQNTKRLADTNPIATRDYREAMSYMANAALYVGPEGGLHHAAAALGIKSVVIFGGFVPPSVTGYPDHINLTGGADEACGSLFPCSHCRAALDKISVEEVYDHSIRQLKAVP